MLNSVTAKYTYLGSTATDFKNSIEIEVNVRDSPPRSKQFFQWIVRVVVGNLIDGYNVAQHEKSSLLGVKLLKLFH